MESWPNGKDAEPYKLDLPEQVKPCRLNVVTTFTMFDVEVDSGHVRVMIL